MNDIRLADPACPICHGEGHIFSDPESIVPIFGRTCDCVLRAMSRADVSTRLEAARLPDRYADASFDRFGLLNSKQVDVFDADRGTTMSVPQSQVDRKNLERTKELAATPLTDETIAFTGPFGVGKTYLACCLLLAQIREHGKRGLYLTTYEYLRSLMPEGAEPEEQRELRTAARTTDVLLLDDLGVEKSSAYAMRELWDLLHYRTSNGLATIVTSNLSIRDALSARNEPKGQSADQREASDLGRRIFSRLAETRVPPITWPEGSTDMRFSQQGATRHPRISDVRREVRRELVDDGMMDSPEEAEASGGAA